MTGGDEAALLLFEFPKPPERLAPAVLQEAKDWAFLDEFDLLVKAEELCGRSVDIKRTALTHHLWGFTYTDPARKHTRIFVNAELSHHWQQFALYHELHHLIHDQRGVYFYQHSQANLAGIEAQADAFAWAVLFLQDEREDN